MLRAVTAYGHTCGHVGQLMYLCARPSVLLTPQQLTRQLSSHRKICCRGRRLVVLPPARVARNKERSVPWESTAIGGFYGDPRLRPRSRHPSISPRMLFDWVRCSRTNRVEEERIMREGPSWVILGDSTRDDKLNNCK